MKEYVLDANALVRLFRNAPGADQVEDLVRKAKEGRAQLSMSVVNLSEVLYVLARYFGQEEAIQCIERARRVAEPVAVDEQVAIDAGIIHFRYKLGLADCFAAELAMRTRATLVTADPEFARLGSQLKVMALPRYAK